MSSFRIAPRQGHLDRLKRMYGYLKRQPDGAIRFRTGIPDHESRDTPKEYEWINSIYGPHKEELPSDMPTPKGKAVRTTTYCDANLLHCLATGRSMSGIVHLVNQTPSSWFCKKQNVVETATYGSEFMVARQATEQIMDLRYTLRMMGIPLDGPAWLFGDNQSVITSSTIPHSNLNKHHNALSYHRVREAIAAKVMYFIHVDGKTNPSDVMTKFLGWAKFWPLIQPFLFWKGETIKGISETSPISQIIATLKEQTPSGLRGVTRSNSVSPSGNLMEEKLGRETSPIGPIMTELQPVIPKKARVNVIEGNRTSRKSILKKPSFPTLPESQRSAEAAGHPVQVHNKVLALGNSPEPHDSPAHQDFSNGGNWISNGGNWTVVSGRKYTQTSQDNVSGTNCTQKPKTSQLSTNCTHSMYRNNAVDYSTGKVS